MNVDNEQYNDEDESDIINFNEIVVDKGQGLIRIDRFLMDRLHKISRNKIQESIKSGLITVDGQQIKPNFRVKPLMVIKIVWPDSIPEDELLPEEIPLDIIFEDNDILIVNKPAGLVVHPGISNRTGTLVNGLAYYFKEKNLPTLEGNLPNRPGLVHRIDKNTSGLLVIAKNENSLTKLAKQFFDHSIKRTYQAIVWGVPEPGSGTITGNIGRDMRNRILMTVYDDDEELGKHAVTHYNVIEDLYYVSLVECNLETGRTHQIRVHMGSINNPIFNDDKYGGDTIRKGTQFSKYKTFVQNCFELIPRQALHAKSLGFVHPTTEMWMEFESELPEDMKITLEKWRTYVSDRRSKLEIE
jgi:23S rRNA pseudouridine1911/1915/1917 synthase